MINHGGTERAEICIAGDVIAGCGVVHLLARNVCRWGMKFGRLIGMIFRKTAGRRQVAFQRLDDVMPDVERLLGGHVTVGRWSLAQICNHLTTSIRSSIDGFPGGSAPWFIRATIGKIARRSILVKGNIPEGAPLPKLYTPQPGLDARAEAETLRAAIAAFKECASPVPHPFVGAMTKEEWSRFHCVHCGHHLSFVVAGGD
jgi:hypothetical protein